MENKAMEMRLAPEVTERTKMAIVIAYGLVLILFAVLTTPVTQLGKGMANILTSPGLLLTDYLVVGGIGAAFLNAGLVFFIGIILVYFNKVKVTGPIIAALFTMGGFALFGKNIINVIPIIFGVWVYSKIKGEPMSKYIIASMFGTTLGPMVSQIALGYGFNVYLSAGLAIGCGILAGMLIPPLAAHLLKAHQGYNIYNMGFTGGLLGTIFMSIFRSYGLNNTLPRIWGTEYNSIFIPVLSIYFLSMIVVGLYYNNWSTKGLKELFKVPGALVSDFTDIIGFGPTFINMGLVGLVGLIYIVAINGHLNGPTIGGLLTMVGFAAFGKHVKNIIPIMLGVYIATLTNIWHPADPGPILAALFGTTLAPIAGSFGPIAGIVAGFLHLSVVMQVGILHGGMNLYNNGFSGGLVATFLTPIIAAFAPQKK